MHTINMLAQATNDYGLVTYLHNFGTRFGSDPRRIIFAFISLIVFGVILFRSWGSAASRIFSFLAMLGGFWLGWNVTNWLKLSVNQYSLTGSHKLISSPSDLVNPTGSTATGVAIAAITFFAVIGYTWHQRRQAARKLGFGDFLSGIMPGIGVVVLANMIYGISQS